MQCALHTLVSSILCTPHIAHNACSDWIDMAFRATGCAVDCPHQVKLEHRPNLDCKLNVTVGDRVLVESDLERCVIVVDSTNGQVVVLNVEDQTVGKYKFHELQLPVDATKCELPKTKTVKAVSTSDLNAVIDAPPQTSVCDEVAINSYKSTNSGPLSELQYRWILTGADSKTFSQSQHQSALTLKHLSHMV